MTGKPVMLQSMRSQRVGHEQLNNNKVPLIRKGIVFVFVFFKSIHLPYFLQIPKCARGQVRH